MQHPQYALPEPCCALLKEITSELSAETKRPKAVAVATECLKWHRLSTSVLPCPPDD